MFCFKCGAKIPDESVFCMWCGTRVPVMDEEPAAHSKSADKFKALDEILSGIIHQPDEKPDRPPEDAVIVPRAIAEADEWACEKTKEWFETHNINGVFAAEQGTRVLRLSGFWGNFLPIVSFCIPDSVTKIDRYAFQCCQSLTNITIPNSVTEIDMCAFAACTSLTSVTIPDSVTEIYSIIFQECTSLTSVVIPNSVTTIYGEAFVGCTSLTSIKIPESVTKIIGTAFYECGSLETVYLPSECKILMGSIEKNEFDDCTAQIIRY